MKIVKIEASLNIGLAGHGQYEILEVHVKDDALPDEIRKACDEETKEWAHNYIEYGWDFQDTRTEETERRP